jgi:lipid II:glycine glycyltransferase (peptidoglycan interpeptide bridge formation enzyme)
VRLSQRKGIIVSPGGEEDLPEFYQLMGITSERDSFAIHSEAYYRAVWECFAPRDESVLLMARYGDEVIAGLMVVGFGSSAAYFYGASSNEHRNRMPNHALQWEAMLWAKRCGYRYYDLWGIPDVDPDSPTAALAGVQRFKDGFGGRVARYVGAFDHVYSRPLYAILNSAWSWRRRMAG